MKSLLSFCCVLLAIGFVIIRHTSMAQDGWYITPNIPAPEVYVRDECLDDLPPTCAYFLLQGVVVETLDFRL